MSITITRDTGAIGAAGKLHLLVNVKRLEVSGIRKRLLSS